MFWGAVVKSGETLRSTQIFEAMEFPALHISQAILDNDKHGGNVRVQVKMNNSSDPIIIALLNKSNAAQSINTYFNMTQTFSIQVISDSAQSVHLSGHFECEGQSNEDDMMYGAEDDEEGSGSDDSEDLTAKKPTEKKNQD